MVQFVSQQTTSNDRLLIQLSLKQNTTSQSLKCSDIVSRLQGAFHITMNGINSDIFLRRLGERSKSSTIFLPKSSIDWSRLRVSIGFNVVFNVLEVGDDGILSLGAGASCGILFDFADDLIGNGGSCCESLSKNGDLTLLVGEEDGSDKFFSKGLSTGGFNKAADDFGGS
ncbi:hypothetical protein WICPIJ_006540 [Wickerhamomyces pijperi]|uniref:Uncharacterized protein n=1 Tax=Wickerhamomyces pijperi TaxID=599730 RepID=A0A9P8Q3T7_WICPI|nr:hypothetical protein WICPIJ_006540 [Wickerhamomyces pijperi]